MEDENKMLRNRLKELEGTALTAINEKQALTDQLQKQKNSAEKIPQEILVQDDKVDSKEIEEMSEAFKAVKKQMASELEVNYRT